MKFFDIDVLSHLGSAGRPQGEKRAMGRGSPILIPGAGRHARQHQLETTEDGVRPQTGHGGERLSSRERV